MHELGILRQMVKQVCVIAKQNGVSVVKYITLQVGETSGCVASYFQKLYPLAVDRIPLVRDAKLIIETVPGRGLHIKEIGY